MKVLLFGEFSGLYKNLNEGLHELDVEVFWVSNGDVWKKIGGADAEIYPLGNHLISKAYNYTLFPLLDKRFQGYDVVQVVTPMIYPWWINESVMKRLFMNNDKIYINAAGSDCFQYRAYLLKKFKYHIYDDNPDLVKEFCGKSLRSKALNHATEILYKRANGIIPIVPFDYEVPFEGMDNVRKTILIPINHKKIQYIQNIVEKKVVFFHGINRVADKGSNYIIDAMKIVENKYPNDVKCIITDRMPYDEYIKKISEANVIIDQCKGYGYGVNACISLAKGRIVMGGAEEEFKLAGDLQDCPIFNITPNVNQIVEQMEHIIMERKRFSEIGSMGRDYIIKHHDYIKIAKQYLEEWEK